MGNTIDPMSSVQPFVVSILDAGQKTVSSVNFSEELALSWYQSQL